MNFSSKHLEAGVDALSSLPTIGRKSALRLALFLLEQPEELTEEIVEALARMRKLVLHCERCHMLSDEPICAICSNPSRNHQLICVVENVRQVMAIEETGQYKGVYHVLGGVISPIQGVSAADLTIQSLIQRVQSFEEGCEIILAISPTIEGDTTAFYIGRELAEYPVQISEIARGVSFGGDIENADEITLSRSIRARLPYVSKTE